jgi:hypothetical protein
MVEEKCLNIRSKSVFVSLWHLNLLQDTDLHLFMMPWLSQSLHCGFRRGKL